MARRWWAQTGKGAFTTDVDGKTRQIFVSAISNLQDASFSYSDSIGWVPEVLSGLQAQTWRSRAFGDFWSHLLVAEGAVDIAAEPELNAWDMVAFAAIVTEAGGQVTGFDGNDPLVAGNALTTNSLLHNEALKIVGQN
jgi:histidinol-phosphatase